MTMRGYPIRRGGELLLACSAALLVACAPPPEPGEELGQARLALVSDSMIFTLIQVFQIHAVKGETASGASVTCGDIPGNYRPGDGMLVPVLDPPKNIPWNQSTVEATVQKFEVPAAQKLVILVKGLTQYSKGIHTIASGCQDNLTFAPGTLQEIAVDVKATTGAACNAQPECELNLVCHKGQDFNGGYCARLGCTGDQDCPPGSTCASDSTTGGICLRRCETQRDCTTSPFQLVQECVGRAGPTSKGCGRVCVWPLWNKANACDPDA
jgi:hypothetical protein